MRQHMCVFVSMYVLCRGVPVALFSMLLRYNKREAITYTACRLHAAYAATYSVLNEVGLVEVGGTGCGCGCVCVFVHACMSGHVCMTVFTHRQCINCCVFDMKCM